MKDLMKLKNMTASDFMSDEYKKFETGGMTKGKFSHKENPLTVVDKKGEDTGMELTGGEGVFDKKAMTTLEQYKKDGNFAAAGKLVFQEMDSWVKSGTAEIGGDIPEVETAEETEVVSDNMLNPTYDILDSTEAENFSLPSLDFNSKIKKAFQALRSRGR